MIAVVTGGRSHQVSVAQRQAFFFLLERYSITTVRHGGAVGVDSYVARVLHAHAGITVEEWLPNYNAFEADKKRAAPTIRNGAMLAGQPWKGVIPPRVYDRVQADMLIAFPGQWGTLNCMRQAYAKKIPIYEVVKYVQQGVVA